jgi:hypothetical protein
MEACSIIKTIKSLILFTTFTFITAESYSQQMITFKDGTKLEVFITYQTKDTVKYYLESQPQFTYIESMNHIAGITPLNPSPVFESDSLERIYDHKKYLHYKHMTIGGSIIMIPGVVLAGLSISGLVSLANEPENYGLTATGQGICVFGLLVGGAAFITGIVMTATGSSNMNKYKEKLHGFIFDLRYTPDVKGISVAYRF